MYIIDGLKILKNDEERENLRKKIISDREKFYATNNGEPEMSMEEIIEEIYAFRREERKKELMFSFLIS